MIDDDDLCPRCGGAIDMMVPAELGCHCLPTELGDHPHREAAPTPLPERPRNLLELFKLHGNGASPPPIGPPPFPEDL